MLPNFIIIGAPRAGTTWIAKNLMEHPNIFIPRCKEVHFFDNQYEKGIEYYESHFADHGGRKAVGEASPEYLSNPLAAERIHCHIPNAKLIVSLRNPVDRLYSRYWHAKARYPENKDISFEEKIKQKPKFIEEGYYYDHLIRFYKYFRRDQILVLLYDDLTRNPEIFLSKICEFIGVDSQYKSSFKEMKINSAASKNYVGKSKILWNLYRVLMKFKLVSVAKKVELANRNEYPEMDSKTKSWLVNDIYFEKNKLLQNLIGKDLSMWDK